MTSWDDEENARRYDAFARRFPMYDRTSEDLVERLGPAPSAQVVDLCCGTGRTTLAVLAALGDEGRVTGVDGSAAMLAIARSAVTDPRAGWLEAPAEEFDRLLSGPVDAVVCNSAIWQTDLPLTFAAVRRALRPGGRFAFNIGRRFLAPAGGKAPGLAEAMRTVAAREYGWVAPPPERPRVRPTSDEILAALERAGFTADPVAELEFAQDLDEQRAWLSIPIFTERALPGLPYEQRMAVLAQAYAEPDVVSQWTVFTATARRP